MLRALSTTDGMASSSSSDPIEESSQSQSSQSSQQLGSAKRPADSAQPLLTSQFAAKKPRPITPKMGAGLKLHVTQRMGAITEVKGDTTQCKEVLLKPLGFKWEKDLGLWRWDGNGDESCDPTREMLRLATRDGVQVDVVDYRVQKKGGLSAKDELRRLMAATPPPDDAATAAASAFDDACLPDDALASMDIPAQSALAANDEWEISDEALMQLPC